MPDMSDKVSGRPDDIPEDVLTEAMRVARYVVAFRENLAAAARPIARAIMADRRTRPPASSMEGWRTVPEAATAQMLADVVTKTEASPEDYQLAAAAKALVPPTNDPRLLDALAGLAADYRSLVAASPIPPEVMK